jgi:hypothetical protein
MDDERVVGELVQMRDGGEEGGGGRGDGDELPRAQRLECREERVDVVPQILDLEQSVSLATGECDYAYLGHSIRDDPLRLLVGKFFQESRKLRVHAQRRLHGEHYVAAKICDSRH